MPSSEATAGVALTPVLVSTTTVVCSGVIWPELSKDWYAAAAWAHVGSVYLLTVRVQGCESLCRICEPAGAAVGPQGSHAPLGTRKVAGGILAG